MLVYLSDVSGKSQMALHSMQKESFKKFSECFFLKSFNPTKMRQETITQTGTTVPITFCFIQQEKRKKKKLKPKKNKKKQKKT